MAGGGRAGRAAIWGVMFQAKWLKMIEGLLNIGVSELLGGPRWIPRMPPYPADPSYVVAASVPWNLPTTHAGGQDDVSSN